MSAFPTIGAFIVTRDGAGLIPSAVKCLQQFADSVIVYVDRESADRTHYTALMSGADVICGEVGGSYERALNICVNHLRTDWVFYLHDDELVGQAFLDRLPRMVKTEYSWRFPHFNLYPDATSYITSAPHYPDFQLRLIPRAMWKELGGWPEQVHSSPSWPCQFSSAHIWHYKFLARSLRTRVERLNTWIEAYPPAGNDHYRAFSIVEDLDVHTEQVTEPAPVQQEGLNVTVPYL